LLGAITQNSIRIELPSPVTDWLSAVLPMQLEPMQADQVTSAVNTACSDMECAVATVLPRDPRTTKAARRAAVGQQQ